FLGIFYLLYLSGHLSDVRLEGVALTHHPLIVATKYVTGVEGCQGTYSIYAYPRPPQGGNSRLTGYVE
ncbi:hypothetical protein, partial [Streptococcus pseudopneumoniae]|uniref:hypothetical protein n=1 Tax=Streptococcus pseudopneumoniae TaxID=257758 RepID=UPI0019D67279